MLSNIPENAQADHDEMFSLAEPEAQTFFVDVTIAVPSALGICDASDQVAAALKNSGFDIDFTGTYSEAEA